MSGANAMDETRTPQGTTSQVLRDGYAMDGRERTMNCRI